MKPTDDDARLRELLQSWNEVPDVPPDLACKVQRAIAHHENVALRARPRWAWPFVLGLDRGALRLAAACVTGGVLLGIGVAEWRRWRLEVAVPAQYLRWIDPTVATVGRSARS